jgi:hypothetical protein
MDYITIATTGNATDFGDMSAGRQGSGGCSDGTYALFGGGHGNGDVIDYVTIATTSNATDFGNLTDARSKPGSLSGD